MLSLEGKVCESSLAFAIGFVIQACDVIDRARSVLIISAITNVIVLDICRQN